MIKDFQVIAMNNSLKRFISITLTGVIALSAVVYSFAAGDKYDFSENHMTAACAISDSVNFDSVLEYGGNSTMAAAYCARWDGPVAESRDPFPASGEDSDIKFHKLAADYHIQNIEMLPLRSGPLDNAAVKKAIMNHGAVYSSLYVNDICFNNSLSSYYTPKLMLNYYGGHAITIIGWDDNYSKKNFRYTPDGNGAFICKNSWGKETGSSGYFYLSYYDAGINDNDIGAAFYGVESKNNYSSIYQYDPLGAVSNLTNNDGSDIRIANVFPPEGQKLGSTENLCAASFYTDMKGMYYEIYAAANYSGKSSLNSGKKVASGMMPESGYHTVEFAPVKVEKGTRFAVIVKLTNPYDDSGAGTFIECPMQDFTSEARAAKGESFYSFDNKNWKDLTDEFENSNICLKAFTKKASAAYTNSDSIDGPKDAINNKTRKAHSSKVYSASELVENGGNISSAFVDYINSAGSKNNSSLIPSPVVIKRSSAKEKTTFPARYDLRDYKCVTSVKDQLNTGSCWAFSACASMESCMLKRDAGLTDIIGNGVYGVKANDIKVRYKQTFVPDYTVDCDAGEDYHVVFESKNSRIVSSGDNASELYACGRGKTDVDIIVKDYYGNTFRDTFTVESSYTVWQWLIVIFLFGFLWY